MSVKVMNMATEFCVEEFCSVFDWYIVCVTYGWENPDNEKGQICGIFVTTFRSFSPRILADFSHLKATGLASYEGCITQREI